MAQPPATVSHPSLFYFWLLGFPCPLLLQLYISPFPVQEIGSRSATSPNSHPLRRGGATLGRVGRGQQAELTNTHSPRSPSPHTVRVALGWKLSMILGEGICPAEASTLPFLWLPLSTSLSCSTPLLCLPCSLLPSCHPILLPPPTPLRSPEPYC